MPSPIKFKYIPSVLLLSSALWLTGLTSNFFFGTITSPVMARPAKKVPVSPLNNTVWQLVGGEMLATGSNSDITLSFSEQGVSGSAGCNRYSSSYQTQNNQLKIKAIASTRMACPPPLMDQEMGYLRTLEAAQSYLINAQGELEIRYSEQGQIRTLRFTKVETQASGLQTPIASAPSLEGTAWNLILIGSVQPLKERPATIAFKDQKISGTGGCNRLMGQFKTEGDRLIINSQMASTMMACPAPLMKQEQKIVEALTSSTRYSINGEGQLLIYVGNDQTKPALVFAPMAEKSRAGR